LMVSCPTMEDKRERRIYGVRLTRDEYRAVQALASELDCAQVGGMPSVSRMLSELAAGSVRAYRAGAASLKSQAEQIREMIRLNPTASNDDIARWLGLDETSKPNVRIERHRMRKRARGSELA